MIKVMRALLSVSNKSGLVEFARGLGNLGVEVISSGGTAAVLEEAGIQVIRVAKYTGAAEVLDGRVKTLHPKIFAGILARNTDVHNRQLEDHGYGRIDLVVVNLYPFERTIEDPDIAVERAIEQIDIGGPSLVRAAAKNHECSAVLVNPDDYGGVLDALDRNEGALDAATRLRLAAKAFAYSAGYEAAISNYFQAVAAQGDQSRHAPGAEQIPASEAYWPAVHNVQLRKLQSLRYGENPHQQGAFYGFSERAGSQISPAFEQLAGQELSYNNIVDLDAAWSLAQDLPACAVCVIKHTNPCGAASVQNDDIAEAFRRALAGDPVSAFGGIVAANQKVSVEMAEAVREIFIEVIVAPAFDPDAIDILRRKKKVRIVRGTRKDARSWVWRGALGGLLLQTQDLSRENMAEARIASGRAPTEEELRDLSFAWAVARHVKSNAIVLVRNQQLVGVGAGQMSRVDAVRLAVNRAQLPCTGAVLASDAFFPFRDGVDEAGRAGVCAIVQPGGSKRDAESCGAADEHQMAMLFTGVRHFRH